MTAGPGRRRPEPGPAASRCRCRRSRRRRRSTPDGCRCGPLGGRASPGGQFAQRPDGGSGRSRSPAGSPTRPAGARRRGSRSRTAPGARRGTRTATSSAPACRAGRPATAPAPRTPGRSSAGRRCARSGARPRRSPRRSSALAGLLAQLGEDRLDAADGRARRAGHRGLHVVVLDVDGQQPERRHVAGVRRHQHDRAARARRSAGTAAASPSRRTWSSGEVAHVQAALDGDLAQRVGLVPGRDLQDARRRTPRTSSPSRGAESRRARRGPRRRRAGTSPPSRCGGIRPSTTCASVTVRRAPPVA